MGFSTGVNAVSTLEVVACLQLVIILLLLEPQERRKKVLAWMLPFGVVCAAFYYLFPAALGLLYEVVSPIKERFGWLGLFTIAGLLAYSAALVFAYQIDAKQNRAIRAGSKEAFDKRVNDLMRDKHYSLEDATAAAAKVRDRKKK